MENWPIWLQFLTAVGAGGIFIKLLDLIFLQPQTAKREYWNWLRDKRFMTYSELFDILMKGGEDQEKLAADYFAIRAKAARASILIDDKTLLDTIDICIIQISYASDLREEMIEKGWPDKERKKYLEASSNARKKADQITEKLRRNLLKPPPTIRDKLREFSKRIWRSVRRKSVSKVSES